MFHRLATLLFVVLLLSATTIHANAEEAPTYDQIRPILENYCYGCHGYGSEEGGVGLDGMESMKPGERLSHHETWMGVWRNIRSQMMPPAEEDQPTREEKEMLARFIEKRVFRLDPKKPDPGRVTIRRLNREEYRYTIEDMFGYRYNTTEAFPADDTGYGFDTIGDVLTISPLMMEKYFDAAQEIVKEVVYTGPKLNPTFDVWANNFKVEEKKQEKQPSESEVPAENEPEGEQDGEQDADEPVDAEKGDVEEAEKAKSEKAKKEKVKKEEAKPTTIESVSWRGETTASNVRWIDHEGEYRITIEYRVQGKDGDDVPAGQLVLTQGEQVVVDVTVPANESRNYSSTSGTVKLPREKVPFQIRFTVDGEQEDLRLEVRKLHFEGPLDGRLAEYPSPYEKIFFDGPPPEEKEGQKAYARKLIRHFGTKAFRRPIDEKSLEALLAIQQHVQALPDGTFEQSIAQTLAAILTSPRFIYRAEVQADPNDPGHVVSIDEYALASRLSYFLWSSLPDDELMQLAAEGKLRANLNAQVDRMLEDPKSERFVRRFVGQWLQANDVETMSIDARRALGIRDRGDANRVFSGTVRRAMREETEMMFAYVLRENRPAEEMLHADYTFLNAPLAKFYGLEDLEVDGFKMRKVDLPADSNRGGVLTQGTFLVVTSNPTRTSPVKRGLFILENILGTPPPPAPPDVPALEEVRQKGKKLSMREQLELHRAEALCNSCHARMDPLGLALENFSYIGSQVKDAKDIETSGKLITGEEFSDVRELSRVLATERKTDFYRCLTEKLLTFALGRGLEYYDTPTVDSIVDKTLAENGGFRQMIHAIVDSPPFQKRRGDGSLLSGN